MLRRMKLALAEAENKNRMNSFQPTDQTDSVIPVNQTISQMSMNQRNPKNQNSTWQNSTRKGTVKADEDFEFQGFPKPSPQFFPPPPKSIANEVQVQSSLSDPCISPNKEFLDHQPIEIKRIPLIFKGKNFYRNKLSIQTNFQNLFSAIAKKSRLQKWKNLCFGWIETETRIGDRHRKWTHLQEKSKSNASTNETRFGAYWKWIGSLAPRFLQIFTYSAIKSPKWNDRTESGRLGTSIVRTPGFFHSPDVRVKSNSFLNMIKLQIGLRLIGWLNPITVQLF